MPRPPRFSGTCLLILMSRDVIRSNPLGLESMARGSNDVAGFAASGFEIDPCRKLKTKKLQTKIRQTGTGIGGMSAQLADSGSFFRMS